MPANYVTHIESSTGRSVAVDKPSTALAGEMLEVRYDLERIKREVSPRDIAAGPANLWRYAPLLPVADPHAAVSLGEGYTPLLDTPRLARALGLQNLAVKDEGRNPSGTFKDRGASVAISRYVELGVKTVAHNSSGNAGGSWSLYAARAGITCVNLLPTDVQPSSLQHCSQNSRSSSRFIVVVSSCTQSVEISMRPPASPTIDIRRSAHRPPSPPHHVAWSTHSPQRGGRWTSRTARRTTHVTAASSMPLSAVSSLPMSCR